MPLLRLVEIGIARAEHQREHHDVLGERRTERPAEPVTRGLLEDLGPGRLCRPAWSQWIQRSFGDARWRSSRSPARIAISASASAAATPAGPCDRRRAAGRGRSPHQPVPVRALEGHSGVHHHHSCHRSVRCCSLLTQARRRCGRRRADWPVRARWSSPGQAASISSQHEVLFGIGGPGVG